MPRKKSSTPTKKIQRTSKEQRVIKALRGGERQGAGRKPPSVVETLAELKLNSEKKLGKDYYQLKAVALRKLRELMEDANPEIRIKAIKVLLSDFGKFYEAIKIELAGNEESPLAVNFALSVNDLANLSDEEIDRQIMEITAQ